MKWAAWSLQILVALALGFSGFMKVSQSREALLANGMTFVEDFSDTQILLIGAAEVAGAIGLIVPAATGIAPILTPLAGTGLTILMGGAVATHFRRGEPVIVPLVLGVLAAGAALLSYRRLSSKT